MPFVTNVSMSDASNGRFPTWANSNTVLIQIQDVDNSPTAKFVNVKNRSRFVGCYQYRFDDCERGPNTISLQDAESLAGVIRTAYERGNNIVVHCHAGICRSGAVTEVCVMYGFDDVDDRYRQPNLLVKNMLKQCLGLDHGYIDASETTGGGW